jgi:hypothetical protein
MRVECLVMENEVSNRVAIRCIAWLGLYVDFTNDGLFRHSLLLKRDNDPPPNMLCRLRSFRARDNLILLGAVIHTSNDDVSMAVAISVAANINRPVASVNRVSDMLAVSHHPVVELRPIYE